MTNLIALLRGINVGGKKTIAMTELRELCEALGFTKVQSYIQSGNLVFFASEDAQAIERKLEGAIAQRFGFAVDVVVRSAAMWPALVKGNPFVAACQREPNLVLVSFSKRPMDKDAVKALRERAKDGERIEAIGEVLYIHYPGGSGRSRLSPSLIDQLVGSPVTARNFRTILKLAELAGVTVPS